MSPAETFWTGQRVLVTGGSSFIGSNLTGQLLARGAGVCIMDDITNGRPENIPDDPRRTIE